jgi:hypothetical protein
VRVCDHRRMTDEDMITAIIELSASGRQTTADGIAQRFNVPPAMITEDLLRLDAGRRHSA